jgi:hypothetical protein
MRHRDAYMRVMSLVGSQHVLQGRTVLWGLEQAGAGPLQQARTPVQSTLLCVSAKLQVTFLSAGWRGGGECSRDTHRVAGMPFYHFCISAEWRCEHDR